MTSIFLFTIRNLDTVVQIFTGLELQVCSQIATVFSFHNHERSDGAPLYISNNSLNKNYKYDWVLRLNPEDRINTKPLDQKSDCATK